MLSTRLACALVADAAAAVYNADKGHSSSADSLRNRIIAANSSMGIVDTIEFADRTLHAITPATAITDPVIPVALDAGQPQSSAETRRV